ncbi:hypothetical protein [Actinomadura madurae]|uniref:hypothetical protein n=1 Tax=Actinomadura madurae TaxID=1993 RepID=UPI0020D21BF4|nr:hypothetical protein [Actinomadura madurae]MCP9985064.1 hypothetical protein [Actinomadura madurae]
MPTSHSSDSERGSGVGEGGAEPPPRLLGRWEIGPPAGVTLLGSGHGPRSWRVDAAGDAYFLKEYERPDRRRVLFRHGVTAALDAAGLPVLAPVPARGGRTLVTAAGPRLRPVPVGRGPRARRAGADVRPVRGAGRAARPPARHAR